jgi:hypothetical protein
LTWNRLRQSYWLGAQSLSSLLDARGLGVALGHDDAPERVAELTRHLGPHGIAVGVAARDAPVVLGRREEDAPAVVRHLHVVEVRPALRIDGDRGAQVDVVGLVVGRSGLLPPLEVVRLPLLERPQQAAVLRQVDVVRDLLEQLHQVLLGSKAGRSGLP